jgi:hypothetical protein
VDLQQQQQQQQKQHALISVRGNDFCF